MATPTVYDTHPTLPTTRPNYKRTDGGARALLGLVMMPVTIIVIGWALQQIFNLLISGHYPVPDMTLVAAVGISLFLRMILIVGHFESDEERWYEAQITFAEALRTKLVRLAAWPLVVGIAWLINYFA